jgi:hypothetical protein
MAFRIGPVRLWHGAGIMPARDAASPQQQKFLDRRDPSSFGYLARISDLQ